MSFRIEKKYNIHQTKIPLLFKWLEENKAIEIFQKRTINSVYFENDSSTMFYDSIEGSLPRKKIRVRKYGDSIFNYDNSNLEYKINSIEGRYKKTNKINNCNKIFKYGIFDKDYGNCFPKIEIKYNRNYYKIFDEIRLTLDTNISYKKFDKKFLSKKIKEEKIVLEVKTQNTNYENYINNNIYFEEIRFSKYCNAFEKIY